MDPFERPGPPLRRSRVANWTFTVLAGMLGASAAWLLVEGSYRESFEIKQHPNTPGVGQQMAGLCLALPWFALATLAVALGPRNWVSWLVLVLPVIFVIGSTVAIKRAQLAAPTSVVIGPTQRLMTTAGTRAPALWIQVGNLRQRHSLVPTSKSGTAFSSFSKELSLEADIRIPDDGTFSAHIDLRAQRDFQVDFEGLREARLVRDDREVATTGVLPPGEYLVQIGGQLP
jgi:hypothetical protein